MVETGAGQRELTARGGQRRQERGRFDAIGNCSVLDRYQFVDTIDSDGRRARADDLRTHAVEEGREICDLGFARGVVDHGRAFGAHRSHQDVFGRTDTRELEQDSGAHHLTRATDDEAVTRSERRTEFL